MQPASNRMPTTTAPWGRLGWQLCDRGHGTCVAAATLHLRWRRAMVSSLESSQRRPRLCPGSGAVVTEGSQALLPSEPLLMPPCATKRRGAWSGGRGRRRRGDESPAAKIGERGCGLWRRRSGHGPRPSPRARKGAGDGGGSPHCHRRRGRHPP